MPKGNMTSAEMVQYARILKGMREICRNNPVMSNLIRSIEDEKASVQLPDQTAYPEEYTLINAFKNTYALIRIELKEADNIAPDENDGQYKYSTRERLIEQQIQDMNNAVEAFRQKQQASHYAQANDPNVKLASHIALTTESLKTLSKQFTVYSNAVNLDELVSSTIASAEEQADRSRKELFENVWGNKAQLEVVRQLKEGQSLQDLRNHFLRDYQEADKYIGQLTEIEAKKDDIVRQSKEEIRQCEDEIANAHRVIGEEEGRIQDLEAQNREINAALARREQRRTAVTRDRDFWLNYLEQTLANDRAEKENEQRSREALNAQLQSLSLSSKEITEKQQVLLDTVIVPGTAKLKPYTYGDYRKYTEDYNKLVSNCRKIAYYQETLAQMQQDNLPELKTFDGQKGAGRDAGAAGRAGKAAGVSDNLALLYQMKDFILDKSPKCRITDISSLSKALANEAKIQAKAAAQKAKEKEVVFNRRTADSNDTAKKREDYKNLLHEEYRKLDYSITIQSNHIKEDDIRRAIRKSEAAEINLDKEIKNLTGDNGEIQRKKNESARDLNAIAAEEQELKTSYEKNLKAIANHKDRINGINTAIHNGKEFIQNCQRKIVLAGKNSEELKKAYDTRSKLGGNIDAVDAVIKSVDKTIEHENELSAAYKTLTNTVSAQGQNQANADNILANPSSDIRKMAEQFRNRLNGCLRPGWTNEKNSQAFHTLFEKLGSVMEDNMTADALQKSLEKIQEAAQKYLDAKNREFRPLSSKQRKNRMETTKEIIQFTAHMSQFYQLNPSSELLSKTNKALDRAQKHQFSHETLIQDLKADPKDPAIDLEEKKGLPQLGAIHLPSIH